MGYIHSRIKHMYKKALHEAGGIIQFNCGLQETEEKTVKEIVTWCNINQGFISAVLSIITALAAVCVPLCIAKKQKQVALFQKRQESYTQLLLLKNFCMIVENISLRNADPEKIKRSISLMRMHFNTVFGATESGDNIRLERVISRIKQIETAINTMPFLFAEKDSIDEMSNEITEIFEHFLEFAVDVETVNVFENDFDTTEMVQFISCVKAFCEKYSDGFEKMMHVG